jgi:hypothetical protein
MIMDPITKNVIHTVGSMFVDNTNLYCWEYSLNKREGIVRKNTGRKNTWGNLLITTGGYLKPENYLVST